MKPTIKPKKVLEECPAHLSLRPRDVPFWDAIIHARAYGEWGRVELALAQQLARVQADIEERHNLVDGGSRVQMRKRGFPSVRSVNADLGVLIFRELNLLKALQSAGIGLAAGVTQEHAAQFASDVRAEMAKASQ